ACGRKRIRLSGTWEPLGGALAAFLGTGGHAVTHTGATVPSSAAPSEAPEARIHLVGPEAPADLDQIMRGAAASDRKPDVFIAVIADPGSSGAADHYRQLTEPVRAGIRTVLLTVPPLLEGHSSHTPRDRWLAQEDVLGIVLHALFTEQLSGPVAASAPVAGHELQGPLEVSGFRYLFTDRDALRCWVSGAGC
ncbi:MAG: hypothetical protein K0Q72_2869, partial [Armatimonadetes bacterium]|nr:hypothetical protein [Armatimonadota bacterium]